MADRGVVQEVQLAIATRPDELDTGFWRSVLGYAALADDNGVDPLGHGSTFWMQELCIAAWPDGAEASPAESTGARPSLPPIT